MSFTTPLVLIADEAPDMWIFAEPLIWIDARFGTLVAPRGFRTDLASIPRGLRNIPWLDPDGLSRRPAAMHDWLYAWRGAGKDTADRFLQYALTVEGTTSAVAEIYFNAVHDLGGEAWARDEGALSTRDFAPPELYQAWVDEYAPALAKP